MGRKVSPAKLELRRYWSDQVRHWQDSGLTQKEYSRKEGISVERLGTCKRRLEREAQVVSGTLVAVPLGIVSSALFAPRPALGLVVNEKYRIEISDTFSPSTLETVLQVLKRV